MGALWARWREGCEDFLGWVEGETCRHPELVEVGYGGVLSWVEGWGHLRNPCCHPIPRHACPPTQETGLASTSLRTLTERLRELAQSTRELALWGPPAGTDPQPPPLALLARVVDLISAAKGLFSWLNRSGAGGGTHRCWVPPVPGAELSATPTCSRPRYLFSTLNDFSASQDIILLCAQLAEMLQAVGALGGLTAPSLR